MFVGGEIVHGQHPALLFLLARARALQLGRYLIAGMDGDRDGERRLRQHLEEGGIGRGAVLGDLGCGAELDQRRIDTEAIGVGAIAADPDPASREFVESRPAKTCAVASPLLRRCS